MTGEFRCRRVSISPAQEANLALLGDAVGLELELEAQEKYVGPFRADILCKDTLNGSWVLVENQLERTDHSHLGQLMTYAAGLDAVTIVWIAESFAEEHRAALDWLNEITDEHINFLRLADRVVEDRRLPCGTPVQRHQQTQQLDQDRGRSTSRCRLR